MAVAKRRGGSFDALIAGHHIGTVVHVVCRDIDGIHFIESKSGQDHSSPRRLLKTWVSFYTLATVAGFAQQLRITTMMMMNNWSLLINPAFINIRSGGVLARKVGKGI